MKTKKYNLGVQKVDVSPGSQGNEKFLYGNQYGQMGAGLGGTLGSGIGMIAGGPMGAQVGKLAGTALGYGAGYLIGNQKGKQIATEMDTQRGNELNINRSIDYQNDNFSGKDMYQDKKMFENTGYLDNKQLYAKYGLKNAPKEKIEVEKDEMIFRKDPKNGRTMLVADFKGGQPHSKGGEDFLAQDGDVIYPGKMRDQIKSLVGQDGYVTDEETFEAYRQQLPEDNESQEMKMGTGGYLGLANDIMNTGSQLMNFNKNIQNMDKQMLSGQPQMPQQQNKAMGSILGAGQSLLGNKQGGAVPVPEYPNGVKSKVIKPINTVTNNYDSNRERGYMKVLQETELDKLKKKHRVQKTLDKILKFSSATSILGLTQLYGDKFKTEAEMQKEKDILKKNKSVPFINSFFQTPEQYWGNSDKVENVTNTFKKEEYDGFIEEIQSLDSESQKEIIDTLAQSGNKELADTLKQTLVTSTTNKPNSLVFSGTNTGKYNLNPNNPLGKPIQSFDGTNKPQSYSNYYGFTEDQNTDNIQQSQNQVVNTPQERFTMKDGKFLDSQYNGKITDTDRLAFKEWLGKQNQDIQRQYYKDNVAKPELPIQSGEDMSRDDIAFQMENEAPFSKAATKSSFAQSPFTEKGYMEYINTPEFQREVSNSLPGIKPYLRENQNEDIDKELGKKKLKYGIKKFQTGVGGIDIAGIYNTVDQIQGTPFKSSYVETDNPNDPEFLNYMKQQKGIYGEDTQPRYEGNYIDSNMRSKNNPIDGGIDWTKTGANVTSTPDSKSSFLNMVPNIIGTGANMLYAHGLTKERPEKRDATRVQLEQMKYQDRSNPQRYQNLLGSKLAMKNATNYAGGSINNLLGATAMSNAAYQQQANQIEQGESAAAMGIDQQNVGIKNQQNILNAQYFDNNKTANEMNDAKTRDIIRQGRLGMATTANQSIQNAQTLQKDNLMQKESDRRYGLQEKLYGNQLKMANEQTEAQDYSTYASLISYRDKYAENDPRRAEIDMLLKRFQKKYNFTNL